MIKDKTMEIYELKLKFQRIRNQSHLVQFHILNKIMILKKFSSFRGLALFMEMNEQSCYKIMSLRKASRFAIDMINSNRIASSKVIMIIGSTKIELLDELVKDTMKHNYSYAQLESIVFKMTSPVSLENAYASPWNLSRSLGQCARKMKINLTRINEVPKEKKNELYNLFSTLQPMIYKAMDVLDDGKL